MLTRQDFLRLACGVALAGCGRRCHGGEGDSAEGESSGERSASLHAACVASNSDGWQTALASGGGRAFVTVADQRSDTAKLFSLAPGELAASVLRVDPSHTEGSWMTRIAFGFGRLWTTGEKHHPMVVIDPKTGSAEGVPKAGYGTERPQPVAVNPDLRRATGTAPPARRSRQRRLGAGRFFRFNSLAAGDPGARAHHGRCVPSHDPRGLS